MSSGGTTGPGAAARRAAGRIDAAFARCREEGRAAFVPFLMAGDPDLAATGGLLRALTAGGADLIELGVPFSDPIADGPVNQRAATRALAAGARLPAVLDLVAREREVLGDVPLVLYTYYNPIHARGAERFAEEAAAAGVDGVLCVDLPPEEAEERYTPALRAHGIDTVFLLAPTSDRARIARVAEASSGFVYYVARTGVTGERGALPPGLPRELRRVHRRVKLPVAVGFGISSAAQVAEVGRLAEGVVVGSALVRLVEESADDPDLPGLVEARVRELAAGLRDAPPRRRGLLGRR